MNKTKEIKRVISFSLITSMALTFGYMNFEPEMAGAAFDTSVVTQVVTQEISVTAGGAVSMSPDLAGMTGGTATGSATFTVITNSSTGFTMSVKSGEAAGTGLTNANSDTILDYTPVGSVPDLAWGAVGASASEFGFTITAATPADTVQNFRDDGSACNAGSNNATDTCWLDFNDSTEIPIISRGTETSSSGEAEVVEFKTEIGSTKHQPSGSYTATITAIATVQ